MTEIVKDKCKEAKIILNSLYILINYFIVNYSSVNQNYFLNCTLFNINLRLSHSFNKECINKHFAFVMCRGTMFNIFFPSKEAII